MNVITSDTYDSSQNGRDNQFYTNCIIKAVLILRE